MPKKPQSYLFDPALAALVRPVVDRRMRARQICDTCFNNTKPTRKDCHKCLTKEAGFNSAMVELRRTQT